MKSESTEEQIPVEKLALLFQRRYGILTDVRKLTEELMEEMNRGDGVSMDLLLDMRQDALVRLDQNRESIALLGESGQEKTAAEFTALIHGNPEDIIPADPAEEQIQTIRLRIRDQIRTIKEEDRILNQRLKSQS